VLGKHVEMFTVSKKEIFNEQESVRVECRGAEGLKVKDWGSDETAS